MLVGNIIINDYIIRFDIKQTIMYIYTTSQTKLDLSQKINHLSRSIIV